VHSLLRISSPKHTMHFSFQPYELHAQPIAFFLVWLLKKYFEKSRSWVSLWTSSLGSLLQFLSTSSVLDTNISNNPSLWSYLKVTDQVSHTYQTRSKITFLYNLMSIFLIANGKAFDPGGNAAGIPWGQFVLSFVMNAILIR
jgi:hypothetical protein